MNELKTYSYIEDHPPKPADLVEVVRCKDCRYYEETDAMIWTCLLTTSGAEVKGYCAWAERRTDDTD